MCSLFRRVEGPFLIITWISAGSLVTYSDHLHSGSLRKRSTSKKNLSLCRTAFLSAWPNFRKQSLKVLKNNGEWRTKSQVFRKGYRSNSSISRPNVAFSPLLFSNDEEFEFSETDALLIIPEEVLVSLVKLIQKPLKSHPLSFYVN